MEKNFFLGFVPMLLLQSLISVAAVPNITTDESALIALKAHITVDPGQILMKNWTVNTSVCNWVGIVCGIRHKRVVAVNVRGMGLIGTIPPHLGNLSFLVRLDMTNNSFHGTLPKELASLHRLTFISVVSNNLGGPIPPWLGALPELRFLYLSLNVFTGEIPQQLGQLKLEGLMMQNDGLTGPVPPVIFNISSLTYLSLVNNTLSGRLPMDMCHHLPMLERLYLFGNNFTGSLPSGIGNCTSLKDFSLSNNFFTGSIPQEIVKLSLEGLDMFNNSLTGVLPLDIFNISTLKLLAFAMNHLTGHLPPSTGGWSTNVGEIYLGQNELSGIIPESISNATNLYALDLASNSFTGFIPDTICNSESLQLINFERNYLTSKSSIPQLNPLDSLMKCKNLKTLSVSYNPLSDNIPVTIGNLSYLEVFRAANCGIVGNIPGAFGNLSNLITLNLQDNYLSGTIPAMVGQSQKLQYLNLAGNKLQGSIPNTLCGLRNLAYLLLSRNQLYGSLPTCIGSLTFLRNLLAASNGLTSVIPLSLWDIKDLLVLNLSSNSLGGELPPEIGNLKVAIVIDLSRNQLSGKLSSSIGNLQNLQEFSLAQNRFQGPIPQSLGSLTSLEFLDLSRNNFSGTIPGSFEKLSYLKYLNLSFNQLEGKIPENGSFINLTAQSFMLNKALCGMPRFQVPPCPHKRPTGRTMLILRYVLPIVASVILITLVLVFALTRCRKREARIPNQDSMFLVTTTRRFSYQELFQATGGFTEDKLLGKGSFSSVYRGTLSDGLNVAIKVFDLQIEGSLKSFDVECDAMRNTRHRNLIKVIGSCSNLDFKALVVNYMPNGSLDRWLHNVPDNHLDILQRMNTMIDVASALEYLHHGHSTPVVHCDVKPSNVLLDEDMVAHLGDYGISKLFRNQESMAQTNTLATIGYIAPEYGSEGIVSTKGDVYSHGILLLETFSRKKPTDEMFAGEMNLKQWVMESLPCAVTEVIDANLLRLDDEHFTVKVQCVKSIMELAVSCCAEAPEERVSVENVLTALTKIRVEFLKNTRAKTIQDEVRV